jgi:hypothetical protein
MNGTAAVLRLQNRVEPAQGRAEKTPDGTLVIDDKDLLQEVRYS